MYQLVLELEGQDWIIAGFGYLLYRFLKFRLAVHFSTPPSWPNQGHVPSYLRDGQCSMVFFLSYFDKTDIDF